MTTQRRTVALLIETSNEYARGLLHGIVAYIREHGPWSTYLAEHGRGDEPPTWLSSWKGDGIIARIENPRIAEAVVASGLPAVDVSAANLVPALPWVETDDAAIARHAIEHLLERGFRNFGFYGDDRYNWSNWRAAEFERALRQAGHSCHMLHAPVQAQASEEWTAQTRRLANWVKRLPKPVGIMGCFDVLGRQLLEACRIAGCPVPDDVAVVGVDNDELLCELANPPMSSVASDTHRTGYTAAALLDKLMSGRKVAAKGYRIEPLGVVARESSDVLAIDDQDVSQALRFIRSNACKGMRVEDVLEQVPLSRRVLESRFRKLVGRTPHEEINRVQINRVKELLRETDLPMTEVAHRAGFEHVEYLSVVFKKKTGVPPSEYRRRSRR